MKRINRKSRRRSVRYAAAAVEFAIVAPLMITFTFGLVELGRIMLVKQTATHATREGARVAIRPTASTSQVVQRVNEELALMSIDGATVETEPASIEDSVPGGMVKIRVRVAIASISWIPDFFNFGGAEIIAETGMRRESTN